MASLIDKDTLVAEIKKRINFNEKLNAHSRLDECNAILSFLDTLEVKEVNLEKEIKDILNQYYYFPEETIDTPTVIRITAHHFFELGLKAQKGE